MKKSLSIIKNSFVFLIALIFSAFLLLLVIIFCEKVPFIEGDNRITKGTLAHFSIGATKNETFKSIKNHYSQEGYTIKTTWSASEPYADELEKFKNKDPLIISSDVVIFEFVSEVGSLNQIPEPLNRTSEWEVKIPSAWVNSIYLKFSDGKLDEIQKSRWLFERP